MAAVSATQVSKFYEDHLGRTPSQSEVSYWTSTGGSATQIANEIRSSTEARNRGSKFYEDYLGRTPSQSEVSYWTSTGGSTTQLANEIRSSTEARNARSKAASQSYLSTLGREASQQERNYWANAGGSVADVRQAVASSQEAQARAGQAKSVQPETPPQQPQPEIDYAAMFAESMRQYQDSINSQLSDRFDELTAQSRQSQTSASQQALQIQQQFSQQSQKLQDDLAAAARERDIAKARAEELEATQKADREMAVSQQLGSLRSGSTSSGSPGSGLGSLQSGRPSYTVANNASRGSVLDRAYKDIDPTDSVLNKNVATNAVNSLSRGINSSRAAARDRAVLASGGASTYYAKRFG